MGALRAARGLRVISRIDFDHPLIAAAHYRVVILLHHYLKECAGGTFGFSEDIQICAAHLALGGTRRCDRARDAGMLKEDGLRYRERFVSTRCRCHWRPVSRRTAILGVLRYKSGRAEQPAVAELVAGGKHGSGSLLLGTRRPF